MVIKVIKAAIKWSSQEWPERRILSHWAILPVYTVWSWSYSTDWMRKERVVVQRPVTRSPSSSGFSNNPFVSLLETHQLLMFIFWRKLDVIRQFWGLNGCWIEFRLLTGIVLWRFRLLDTCLRVFLCYRVEKTLWLLVEIDRHTKSKRVCEAAVNIRMKE